MRIRSVGWAFLICASLGVIAHRAADAQSPAGADVFHAQSPPVTAGPEAAIGLERQVTLSPQEEVKQADAYLSRIAATGSTVRRMLEQARAQRDVVKTLCLNDKLNQIDVAQRSADDRRTALGQAVQRNDSDLANHEFTILTVLRQRVEQLGAESNQCVGEELTLIGESKVTTVIDPNLPNVDPSAYPDYPVVSIPPVCASCVK